MISLQLKSVSKIATIYLSEGLMFFPAMDSKRSETKHSSRLRGKRQIDTQQTDDDCSHRCRHAACNQHLAHLAETGKNLKKWPLRLVK